LLDCNTSTALDPLDDAVTELEIGACDPSGRSTFMAPWFTEVPENVSLKTTRWRVSFARALTPPSNDTAAQNWVMNFQASGASQLVV
jgi:hypothetical protein